MADITKELDDIAQATAGEDVRWSIHDGIKKINEGTMADNAKNRADITKIATDGVEAATGIANAADTKSEQAVSTANAANTKATEAVSTANAAKQKVDDAWDVNQSEKAETMWTWFSHPNNKRDQYFANNGWGNGYLVPVIPSGVSYINHPNNEALSIQEAIDDIITGKLERVRSGLVLYSWTTGWLLSVLDVDHQYGTGLHNMNLKTHWASCLLSYSWNALNNSDKALVTNQKYFGTSRSGNLKYTDTTKGYPGSLIRAIGYEEILPRVREVFGDIFVNFVPFKLNVPTKINNDFQVHYGEGLGYLEIPTMTDLGITPFSNNVCSPFDFVERYIRLSGFSQYDADICLQEVYPFSTPSPTSILRYNRRGYLSLIDLTSYCPSPYFLVNIGDTSLNVNDNDINWIADGWKDLNEV